MTNPTPSAAPLTGRQLIDTAPLGALIRFSDGTPRPPERFKNKLSAWKNNNATGRLVEKTPASDLLAAHFKLHIGDFGANGITVIKFYQTYMADADKTFFIEQLPQPGCVKILDKTPRYTELVHLAPDQAAAETWIAANGSRYTLEPVL